MNVLREVVSMMGLNVCKYNALTALPPSSCCARVWVYHSSRTQSSCFVLSLNIWNRARSRHQPSGDPGARNTQPEHRGAGAGKHKQGLEMRDAILSVWRMVRALVMEFLCPVLECLMKNHMMSMSSAQQLGDHQSLLRMIQIQGCPLPPCDCKNPKQLWPRLRCCGQQCDVQLWHFDIKSWQE